MEEHKPPKGLKSSQIAKYTSLMERRLWRDWSWRRRWTRHSRGSMYRYLRKHYHLTPHQSKMVLDNMTSRNMLIPEIRRGRQYWISSTVDTANKITESLKAGPANKRKLIFETKAPLSQFNRAAKRLAERGLVLITKTRCPMAPEEGISPKEMTIYSLEEVTPGQVRGIRREIRESAKESEKIYGEQVVEKWLRREYGPDAKIEKEWQIPNLAAGNAFDYLVTTPDGTRIPVEIKGWRWEEISQESARVEQFRWKMARVRAEKGLFFAPYAQTSLPDKMAEMGIKFIPLKFPKEEEEE